MFIALAIARSWCSVAQMKRTRLAIAARRATDVPCPAPSGGVSRSTQTASGEQSDAATALRKFLLNLWQDKKLSDKDICLAATFIRDAGASFDTYHNIQGHSCDCQMLSGDKPRKHKLDGSTVCSVLFFCF